MPESNPWKKGKLKRKPKRYSLSRIAHPREDHIPASWVFSEEGTAIANAALSEFVFFHAIPRWRVYFNQPVGALGRCFPHRRIITLAMPGKRRVGATKDLGLHVLAHEVAHAKYISHGKKHESLTEEIYEWIQSNWMRFV